MYLVTSDTSGVQSNSAGISQRKCQWSLEDKCTVWCWPMTAVLGDSETLTLKISRLLRSSFWWQVFVSLCYRQRRYVVVAPHRVVRHSTTHVSFSLPATGMCDCLDFKARDIATHIHTWRIRLYSVSQKNPPPLRFSDIFSQTDGNFLINFCTPIIRSFLD